MKEIISPIAMNGFARRFRFVDVKGYKKSVELLRDEKLHITYTRVKYERGNLVYFFHLFDDRVVFFKASVFDDEVTYKEFEKFCKIN